MNTSRHSMIFGIIMILFLAFSPLNAQFAPSNYIFRYSSEQALSSNIIYSILQDNKGLIWIATEDGLNKFDGKNFTHFSVNSGRYSLSHNRTQTMLLAPDGNIWAGTSDGLNIYDYKADSIIQVNDTTKPMQLVYDDITYLTLNNSGSKVWIGTYGNGVNYYDWQLNKFGVLKLPVLKNVDDPKQVMTLLEDDNRRLWIGTQDNGLYRYSPDDNKLEHYQLSINGRFIRSIFQDSFRRIWIGTSKGCFVYNETTNLLESVSYPEALNNSSIGSIVEDKNGKIWIGTEYQLFNFSVRSFSLTEKFQYAGIYHGESVNRLSCPSINSIFVDRDNNVWIGTQWGGVNMLNGTPNKFVLHKHDSDNPYSLPNSPVNAICSIDTNTLIVATMGSNKTGICSFNITTGNVKPLPVDKKLRGYVYQTVILDSDNNLWVGTYNKGLLRMDKEGNNYMQFLSDINNEKTLHSNDVRTIFESKKGDIWLGTNGGLARINKKTNAISRVELNKTRTIGVRAICEDNTGKLWIGTYGSGVFTYTPATGVVVENALPLSPQVVTDLLVLKNTIYVASLGEGLKSYELTGELLKHYTTTNGLSSNYLSSLNSDNSGKIWIGSGKGISHLDPLTNEIVYFGSGDGIQGREFSERATLQLPNGQLVFAGFSGINIFNPLNVTKNDKCPMVVFTKLLVFNELTTPSEDKKKYSPIKDNISMADRITLKHNQSVFTIEFMGINYNANSKLQYAYFLEGSDKKWNYIGNQNNVTFRNLPAGHYQFNVKASSPDAVWDDSCMASIQIEVLPPIWASFWAYLIYSILSVIIIYYIWYFAKTRIQTANNLKIERAKREKDEELHQEKLQFFTNISHEFRTPLTLIIGPLEKMHEIETEVEKMSSIKLMIRNANRLLNMVNQLLDFRKAERGQMKLKVQEADILPLLHEIIQSFDELARQKNIDLSIDCPFEMLNVWFDSEFINKSLFNLLSNAFKFTPENGHIVLKIEVQYDTLGHKETVITLTDDGKGILAKDIHSIFDRFYQGEVQSAVQQGSGIGLHLVKSLIELHHGVIDVESTPGVSTCFRIILPNEESAYLKEEKIYTGKDSFNSEIYDKELLVSNSDNADVQKTKKSGLKNQKQLLVVENNADIRTYIKNILGSAYEISEAENGKIGLEMALIHEYDLIISDIMMPEMDGIELCKQLKSSIETSHVPIILLTAKSGIDNRIEGLNTGADSYITKPFHPQHLTVRVGKLIELREKMKERFSKKISLNEIQKTADSNIESPGEQFLQKAIKIILDKMMDTNFNGDALAVELCISRMGLHRKVKALTGQSTGEFIRNIRLKKAAELLRAQGLNVSEVCYDVGFSSPSYFTTCFTEVYKMTPTEYSRKFKVE